MILLNHQYTILFATTSFGVGTAADATPVAVLYRNGAPSGVSVTVSTTAQTGLYKAVFTTAAGWSSLDHLELYATATIGGTAGYLAKIWSSTEYANTVAPPTTAELDAAVSTIRGADGDTLETLSDQIDAVNARLASAVIKTVSPVTQTGDLQISIGTDDVGRWELPVRVAAGASLRDFLQSVEVAAVYFIAARKKYTNEIVVEIDPDDIPAPAEDGSITIPVSIPRGQKPSEPGVYPSRIYVRTSGGLWHDETASTLYLDYSPGTIQT